MFIIRQISPAATLAITGTPSGTMHSRDASSAFAGQGNLINNHERERNRTCKLQQLRAAGRRETIPKANLRLSRVRRKARSGRIPRPSRRAPDHPLQSRQRGRYGAKVAAYEGSKVEDRGLPPTGRRRRGLPPLTPLRGEGWRRLRGGLEGCSSGERERCRQGCRRRRSTRTYHGVHTHLALSPRVGLDIVREADRHHHRHPFRPFSQFSQTRGFGRGFETLRRSRDAHTHCAAPIRVVVCAPS